MRLFGLALAAVLLCVHPAAAQYHPALGAPGPQGPVGATGPPGISSACVFTPRRDGAVTFYVDSDQGLDTKDGLSPHTAFLTLGKAVSSVVDERGDLIYLMPTATHYNEHALITLKSNLTIIGGGNGGFGTRTIVFNDTTGVFDGTDAFGVCIENIWFEGQSPVGILGGRSSIIGGGFDLDSDSVALSVVGSDVLVNGVWFETGGLSLAGVDAGIVDGCRFTWSGGADIALGASAHTVIRNCDFVAKEKTNYITATTGAGSSGLIHGNFFADKNGIVSSQVGVNGTSIRFVGNYDAKGLINGSAF